MTSRLNPYISFDGAAKDAMEFYRGVFGGELATSTYGEGGMAEGADGDRLMHAQLETPNGMTLMGADSPPGQPPASGAAITISLSGEDEDELKGYWNGLLEGGTVTMPLEKAPWGDQFGMLTDRFGVGWMVNIAGTPPQS